jgi:hypothetical protein
MRAGRISWTILLAAIFMAAGCAGSESSEKDQAGNTADVVADSDGRGVTDLPVGEGQITTDVGAEILADVLTLDSGIDGELGLGDDADIPEIADQLDGSGDLETDVQPTDVEVVEEVTGPEELDHFPSPELGIRILAPNSSGVAQSAGAIVGLAGVVVGKPDTMYFETDNGLSGYLTGMPFWNSEKVELQQGDNWVTVTATKGQETVTDTVMVTYNPAFLFGGYLKVLPRGMFTNTATNLQFTIDLGLYQNFEDSTLKCCQCTREGECISDVGAMNDGGPSDPFQDEVQSDSIYSAGKSYNLDDPGKLCFRAHVQVKSGYVQYTAYSPVTCIDVVDHVTQERCEEVVSLQQEAKQLYADTVQGADADVARQAVIDLLEADDSVAQSGADDGSNGIWVHYEDGLLGALDLSPEGMRGSGAGSAEIFREIAEVLPGEGPPILVQSKVALAMSPYHSEFEPEDEATFGYQLLDKSECPSFVLDTATYGPKADLGRFRRLWEYGVIVLTTHGDSYFKGLSEEVKKDLEWPTRQSQELLWTGEEVDCSQLVQTSPSCNSGGNCPSGTECVLTKISGSNASGICIDDKQLDLRRGRVVFGAQKYGVLPAFVRHYPGFGRGYPASLVYLGSCRSLWNGSLAMELYGMGARAIIGFSDHVTNSFAYEEGSEFLSSVLEEHKFVGDAMPAPAQDPVTGAEMRLLGAHMLNAFHSDIINASWESGDLTGWQMSGDGRVISQLCCAVPVDGKFMSLISTGLGFTQQVGEIYQTFCIPDDKIEMSFYWKFFSEEFKEYCGSMFQDTFEATLESEEGQVTCVSATVDNLCPPQECVGCGSQFDGLVASCCSFDQGDAWETLWRQANCNVMALAGKGATTLRFFATDLGDSIYDTVILMDAVQFK